MAAGDPTSALQWVGIALAVSTDSRQLGNEGRLLYLRGRCYQVGFLCARRFFYLSRSMLCAWYGI